MLNRIYSEHKIALFYSISILALFFVIVFYFDFLPKEEKLQNFSSSFTSNTITFTSIYFGFYFTSMSILFSSKYISHLNDVDEKKPEQLKVHTFRAYFLLSIYFITATIATAFLLIVFGEVNLILFKIIFSILSYLIVLNLCLSFLLLKVFLNALIIQASEK